LKLALRPTIPARERYYANPRPARRGNAPLRHRGRPWGQCSGRGFRRERCGSRSGGRAGELGEDRQVGMGPDPIQAANREAAPAPNHASSSSASAPIRRPRAQAWARRRRPVSVRCRRSAPMRCRDEASGATGASRFRLSAGRPRSAAAPLKRKSCEPGCAVSANVTHSGVFPHARVLSARLAGGATQHREFAHAYAL
jgi:hypothetical protein